MCGNPAVPKSNAIINEMLSKGGLPCEPGLINSPLKSDDLMLCISPNIVERLKSKCNNTKNEIITVPIISNTALTICTQLVAVIPPNNT